MATFTFQIKTQWDSIQVDHQPIVIKFSGNHDDNFVSMEVDSPFFNDPAAPTGKPGKPFPHLWDYEVVEAFFLGQDDKYLEVELCPHGQHLVLALNGFRNIYKEELPLEFQAVISDDTWHGIAKIPMEYFPPNMRKFNAFAIHGSADRRIYEALYPTPHGKYSEPDFHRLEYFQEVDFGDMIHTAQSDLWTST